MSYLLRRLVVVLIGVLLVCPAAFPAKKKEKPEITQVLPLPKDLPQAIVADVQRLTFQSSPLTSKGLLSHQIRESLKALLQLNKGASIVKLRAFVAGSGDLRRVQTIVSETFTEKKLNLPVLSVVQVGGLPLEGAQVVLESISSDRKIHNEHGLAFVSGQRSTTKDPASPLLAAVRSAGLDGPDVRRVTCFLSTLDNVGSVRGLVQAAFPAASANFVQTQRGSLEDLAECEAVAALRTDPGQPLTFAESAEARYSNVALVAAGKIAISGSQLAFHQQDADVRLAFERLGKALESVGATYKNVAMTHIYPLSRAAAERVRKIQFEYYDSKHPPASTMLLFEGLPSLDAAFAIDVISVLP